ncbi:hypothetical protein [Nitrobacter sp.]|nr:hypothetical protein [Nitrobacter sp.]
MIRRNRLAIGTPYGDRSKERAIDAHVNLTQEFLEQTRMPAQSNC